MSPSLTWQLAGAWTWTFMFVYSVVYCIPMWLCQFEMNHEPYCSLVMCLSVCLSVIGIYVFPWWILVIVYMLLCVKYHTFLDLNLPDFWDKAWLWNYTLKVCYWFFFQPKKNALNFTNVVVRNSKPRSRASNELRYSSEDSSEGKPAHSGSLYNMEFHLYYGYS